MDGEETSGSRHNGITSDPTRPDTDFDGYNDYEDVDPQYDLAIQIKVSNAKTSEQFKGDKVKVKVSLDQNEFVSSERSQGSTNFYVTYNIPDNGASIYSIDFNCWQASDGLADTDGDTRLGSEKTIAFDLFENNERNQETYEVKPSRKVKTGWFNDKEETYYALMKVTVKTVRLERSTTYMIVPEDESMRLYTTANGEHRYIGEQRFYFFSFNIDGGGIQNILVPESIFYGSQIGNWLQQSEEDAKESPLYYLFSNLQFTQTDPTGTESSSAIRGFITTEDPVSSGFAQLIITYLCLNTTGVRTFKSMDITDELVTMGLAEDIIREIPLKTPNMSKLGKINSGWLAATAADIADVCGVLWNVVVGGVTFLVSVGLALVGAIWEALKAIVSLILEALNILFEWIKGIVKEMIMLILRPILDAYSQWIDGINQVLTPIFGATPTGSGTRAGLTRGGTDWAKAGENLYKALFSGGFFYLILGLAIGLQVVAWFLTGMQFVPGIGALAAVVISIVVTVLAGAMLGEALEWIGDQFHSPLYALKSESSSFWKEGVGLSMLSLMTALALLYHAGVSSFKQLAKTDAVGLLITFFGLFLAFFSGWYFAFIGMCLAAAGFAKTLWPDQLDRAPGPFKYIEETLAAVCLGYAYFNCVSQLPE